MALFDIDDLERVVETNLNGRRLEAERAEGFVIGAVQGFSAWRRGLTATPAIASLHARGEEIRRAELERIEAQWEGLSEADRERLEALTKGIVSKLLHEPTVRVRAAAEDGDALRHLESLRHLFALEAPALTAAGAVHLILATRRSPLALAQTELVAARLRAAGHETEALPLTTTGDRWSAEDRTPAPDRGLFVKELEEALLDGRAHLAVHSAKDLPGDLPEGLAIVAVPPREDPRDVLVGPAGRPRRACPRAPGSRTGSPRRAAQLLAARPDLVDRADPRQRRHPPRQARARRGRRAGARRRRPATARAVAGRDHRRCRSTSRTPAPGQGLLAVEARADGAGGRGLGRGAATTRPPTPACAPSGRFLRALGGGCMRPLGALCETRRRRLAG